MQNNLQKIWKSSIGLNCLVPHDWWCEFILRNAHINNPAKYVYPKLETKYLTDQTLFIYQKEILNELQYKTHCLDFKTAIISPQPFLKVNWKVVPIQFWKELSKFQNVLPIFTYLNNQESLIFPTKQIQIIFCGKTLSDVFIGFLPENSNLLGVIRDIGKYLDYTEMYNSKVSFPCTKPDESFSFFQIQNMKINNCFDTMVLAFNLDKQDKNILLNEDKNDIMNDSNEAVVGDFNNLAEDYQQDVIFNDGTISTGEQTPFFLFDEIENIQNGKQRISIPLLKEKKPEQILQIKIQAKKNIIQNLMQIPEKSSFQMQNQLEQIAEEILKSIIKNKEFQQ